MASVALTAPLASVADTIWAIVALVGGVGAIAFMIWIASRGTPERDQEDAARTFYDDHGHWPDEDPPEPGGRLQDATEALRSGSIGTLQDILVALLHSGEEQWQAEERELMAALAPFHHATRRLGADVATLFADAADHGPPALRDAVVRFGLRHDVMPHSFGFMLVEERGGPAYYWTR